MNPDTAFKSEHDDAIAAVIDSGETKGSSCAAGKCPFSSPKVMAFSLPFFAVLAIEQWATSSNTCLTDTVCQMCVMTKTSLALAAGMVGLALQKLLAKR
ncbi:hypothetical protein BH11CYA1_BH11CYA1_14380 [soil metagenome]